MNIYNIMKERRSVRSYKKESVPEEKLERILEAARNAPSAANRQPVCFFVIKDEKVKKQLKEAYNEEWFSTAPVIIGVCSIPEVAWKRGDGMTISRARAILKSWKPLKPRMRQNRITVASLTVATAATSFTRRRWPSPVA